MIVKVIRVIRIVRVFRFIGVMKVISCLDSVGLSHVEARGHATGLLHTTQETR
jgi:hypothetical protein